MSTFLTKNFNEMNLEFTPHTKALLEIYIKSSDEELIVTNRYLKSELIRLYQTSTLVDLIIYEWRKSSLYDGQSEVFLEGINLNYTPHSKNLIKQHLSYEYEGTIEPTLVNLMAELIELHRKGKLGYLFSGEWIYSPKGLEPVN